MYSMKKMSVSGLVLVAAMIGQAAHAEVLRNPWNQVDGLGIQVQTGVLRRATTGNTSQQAADQAELGCGEAITRLQQQGYLVLAFRGTAASTPSPYMFIGNCDVQTLRK